MNFAYPCLIQAWLCCTNEPMHACCETMNNELVLCTYRCLRTHVRKASENYPHLMSLFAQIWNHDTITPFTQLTIPNWFSLSSHNYSALDSIQPHYHLHIPITQQSLTPPVYIIMWCTMSDWRILSKQYFHYHNCFHPYKKCYTGTSFSKGCDTNCTKHDLEKGRVWLPDIHWPVEQWMQIPPVRAKRFDQRGPISTPRNPSGNNVWSIDGTNQASFPIILQDE